jgi:putative cardiolipin synthase
MTKTIVREPLRLLLFLSPLLCLVPAGCGPSRLPPAPAPTTTAPARLPSASGKEAFALLDTGPDALLARLALAGDATRSIDLQTYIWDDDASGKLLGLHFLRAADRGVRVRLLIDAFGNLGATRDLALLDSHPLIEVRLFHPFKQILYGRTLDYLLELPFLHRRMHSKSMTFDNEVTIIGGRNVANRNFGLHPRYNCRDFDVCASGPVVGGVSEQFEQFWASEWSVPLAQLTVIHVPLDSLPEETRNWEASLARHDPISRLLEQDAASLHAWLHDFRKTFVPGKAILTSDPPEKIKGKARTDILALLRQRAAVCRDKILVVTPYLGPVKDGEPDFFQEAAGRGIPVTLLASSLAGNNTVIGQVGYAEMRPTLLRAGLSLHELKAWPQAMDEQFLPVGRDARTGLHAKAVVFDESAVFIGSFNFDPRSYYLNTETGLLIESPPLARRAMEAFAADMRPENSWSVTLAPATGGNGTTSSSRPAVVWTGMEQGKMVTHRWEPRSNLIRCFSQFLLGLLPIDHYL